MLIGVARTMKLRRNPGFYRISIDDYGLYVHSDEPSLGPSFSIIAPDICCLVRTTTKHGDTDDTHEYYVETKSGKRHEIGQLFADYDLDGMELFDKITDRFPWAEILEEVKG